MKRKSSIVALRRGAATLITGRAAKKLTAPKPRPIATRKQRRDAKAQAELARRAAAVEKKAAKKIQKAQSAVTTPAAPRSRWARLRAVVRRNRSEIILVMLLLAVSLIAHAWNMYNYPYLENDEATYTSRGWAFITSGQLDVYTYRYDHAPLGWMLVGIWDFLAGGAHIFGSLLNSGRVLMLVVHLVSTFILYILAKRFSGGGRVAPTIAVLLFALSPLGIYFQRRILLDNIMTLWLLVSILVTTSSKRRLKQYIWGGAAFGIAVLTKLNAVFLGPAFLYIIWRRAKREHRLHALSYWLAAAGIVVLCFFLFALLKGELFSAPLGPDGKPTHVSVVDTFALQLGRGDFAWFWQTKSSFMQNVLSWMQKDWFTLAIGAVSGLALTVVGLFRRKKEPYLLFTALLCWCLFAFLARGKIVLDLYIVPVIPLFALATGLCVQLLYRHGLRSRLPKVLFMIGIVAILGLGYGGMVVNKQYTVNEVANQDKALQWVIANVPKNAVIASDNYAYPSLVQEHGFTNVTYFFNTEYDPEVRKTYGNDWRNVEYIIVTHEIIKQIKTGTIPQMKDIFDHATLVADFQTGSSSFIDLKNYISTNGDWAQVYKVKDRQTIVQQDSWDYFKNTFIIDYGQVIDPSNNDHTTSAGQANAMLRALDTNDKDMFGGLWQWSRDHLQYRQDDKLLSWSWEKQATGNYGLADANTVCDADQQIAYALLQAGERWHIPQYTSQGKEQLTDWYRKCTFERNGHLYLDSSADGSRDIRLINPGYFNPAYYRYFAIILPELGWSRLIDDGYQLLDNIHNQWQTIPNWVIMNPDGTLQSATDQVGAAADTFGNDSVQLVPYLTADLGDPRAAVILRQLVNPVTALARSDKSAGSQAAELLLFQAARIHTPQDRQALYHTVIFTPYHANTGAWHDGKDYRDQTWLWQWHRNQHLLPKAQQVNLE